MKRIRKYFTEEERKAARRESQRKYYQNNKEKLNERQREYYKENKEKALEQRKKSKIKYRSTKKGRAANLIDAYKQNDKKYNRGECTLTPDWLIINIFTKCHYCGESDWHKLGCDRIDNSKPHTIDNVVPCCEKCNKERNIMSFNDFEKKKGVV